MQYRSKKGKMVQLTATWHAQRQFAARYHRLHGVPCCNVLAEMCGAFNTAQRVSRHNLKKIEQKRLVKYGHDTLFFRCADWTFVVQNAVIVTVEVSRKGKRKLNYLD